ncbi:uncharacterized protein MONBRDRAFT_38845 [Monosiga brevicollis MX1]|uniref:J domain-containing protein n=1 Tax=Monosiga brevicollis TaxID=81824 RepID=A9VAH4_MONBE|nr:uncharacterized protein MONBRDRAFT_38845 [Monosiga brevicollis MX1]EDQ85541.1 predicted protein [Monosiga brevicollis MX1]|eukprot:XP_001749732.1 hypothetical protein [Monosiga brevicollis MX1]
MGVTIDVIGTVLLQYLLPAQLRKSAATGTVAWKRVFRALALTGLIFAVVFGYNLYQDGPNFYQLLDVPRDSTCSVIKKAYRNMGKELHPDKVATQDSESFQVITYVRDVLCDANQRHVYERFGPEAVEKTAVADTTLNNILLGVLPYYIGSLVLLLALTSGVKRQSASGYCWAALAGSIGLEVMLRFGEVDLLPRWINLLPYQQASMLHTALPLFITFLAHHAEASYVDIQQIFLQQIKDELDMVLDILYEPAGTRGPAEGGDENPGQRSAAWQNRLKLRQRRERTERAQSAPKEKSGGLSLIQMLVIGSMIYNMFFAN